MTLPGIVTNVTAFGAFVDVGVHHDGLVHVSQLADRFVKDPSEVVKVHQKVTVTVLSVDLERRRISLSMRKNPEAAPERLRGADKEATGKAEKQPDGRPRSGKPPRRKSAQNQPKREAPAPNTALAEALKKAGLR